MDKKQFIEGILKLDSKSKMKGIDAYLNFDMKQLPILDLDKIISREYLFKSDAVNFTYKRILKEVSNDLAYKKNVNIKSVEDIKNWLRYRIATSEAGLYTQEFDCDSSDLVKEVLKELILPNVSCVEYMQEYDCDNRFIIDNTIEMTTDTINSFATTFNAFLKKVQPQYFSDWVKYFQLNEVEYALSENIRCLLKDIYLLLHIENWYINASNIEKDVWEKFNSLASQYHTIGNFVLVPKGFNSRRYERTNDYWDLSLRILMDMNKFECYESDDYKWYVENYRLFNLNTYFEKNVDECDLEDNQIKEFYPKHLQSYAGMNPESMNNLQIPSTLYDISQCVDSMLLHIKIRGCEILSSLNSNLECNKTLIRDMKRNKVVGEHKKSHKPKKSNNKVVALFQDRIDKVNELIDKLKRPTPENVGDAMLIGVRVSVEFYTLLMTMLFLITGGYKNQLSSGSIVNMFSTTIRDSYFGNRGLMNCIWLAYVIYIIMSGLIALTDEDGNRQKAIKVIMTLFSRSSWGRTRRLVINMFITFVVIPLVMLVLENLVGIGVVGIIAVIVIGCVLLFFSPEPTRVLKTGVIRDKYGIEKEITYFEEE